MNFSKIIIFFVTITLSFLNIRAEEPTDCRHVLYLMHSGEFEKSFSEYQEIFKQNNKHDFETLQQMALSILQNGAKSEDPEIQQLTMFGAGLAASNASIDILEIGISSPIVQTQLTSLHFISFLHDDRTDQLLSKAMSSEFLPTRMQAAYNMAIRKHPHAIGQIESLMYRLPPFLKPYFPSLFAIVGTPDAMTYLKKFLNDSISDVRIEAILSIAHYRRDDLLVPLRQKINVTNIGELEACCFALGQLKDISCKDRMIKLSTSSSDNVKIAASKALYALGEKSAKVNIEYLAKNNNPHAIAALAEVEGSEDLLASFLDSKDLQIRINAAAALLKKRDSRSINGLKEIFIRDFRDIGFQPSFSIGRSMMCWKVISSATQRSKDPTIDLSMSLGIRESILKETLDLSEEDFLQVANMIFDNQQNDLVPYLVTLLENLGSDNAKALLKEQAKKTGAPLIRDYCNLALFKLKEEGPYEKHITSWLKNQNRAELIQLNPIQQQNKKSKKEDNLYLLTSEETTRLLIEIYTTLAGNQNEKNIMTVIDAIKTGNRKNMYALAGLLMRATE